jgi:hypothetical protein
MKRNLLILLVLLLVFSACYVTHVEPPINPNEQSKVLEKSVEEISDKNAAMLYGEIIDLKTNEKMPYAYIELKSFIKTHKTTSDDQGKFQFQLNEYLYLTYKVSISYIGFKPITIDGLQFESGKAINVKIGMFSLPEYLND